eukprot:TRINITY_DN16_c0_g2_i3.p1 TRINITY_DN16_c0_g2~~TRINITY_DN16_c0_g2_i3.p1  ORF type:complete len:529 (-),score=154.81 TRINITY_DN16_c0_g2_i3:220-1806(-)
MCIRDRVSTQSTWGDLYFCFDLLSKNQKKTKKSKMATRPLVGVYDPTDEKFPIIGKIPLPAVFTAPLRSDIVQFVHSNLNKNRRQAHGVDPKAGMKHSAESWGTGRAVARIPRISGSGTNRSGQGAFGNQCRKGRMFAPIKIWRRWHRRVNINQKRHAVASAIAASGIVPLVLGRGHRINNVHELPLIISDKIETIEKTKKVVAILKKIGAYEDIEKVIDTKVVRAGVGKARGRRYHLRKGPLIVCYNENINLVKAVRNIPGVDICNVKRLNILQLAPGGQMGRFIIWTESAFKHLNQIFGTYRYTSIQKRGYQIERPLMSNADLARIINSNEIQSAIKPADHTDITHTVQKKNPLTNKKAKYILNPNARLVYQTAIKAQEDAKKKRDEIIKEKRKVLTAEQKKNLTKLKKSSSSWYKIFAKKIQEANTKAITEEDEYKKLCKYVPIEEEFVIKKEKGGDEEEEEAEAETKEKKAEKGKDEKGKEGGKEEKGKEGAKEEKGKEGAKEEKGKEGGKEEKGGKGGKDKKK